MSSDCIFCRIVSGKTNAYRIWENDSFLAFLSIFPNTDGVTVVIPKMHVDSYIFEADKDTVCGLFEAASVVAKMLDSKLPDVGRTALVFEGFGVNHLHAKLFPMHGTVGKWKQISSNIKTYANRYEGYISSHDGPSASEESLLEIQRILLA